MASSTPAPGDPNASLTERIATLQAHAEQLAIEAETTFALLTRERAERRRIDAALSTANQMIEGLFAHAPVALEIFDREGFSFRMNATNRRLLAVVRPEDDSGEFHALSDPLMVAGGHAERFAQAYTGEVVHAPDVTIGLADEQAGAAGDTVRLTQTIFPIFDEEGAVSAVVACSVALPAP